MVVNSNEGAFIIAGISADSDSIHVFSLILMTRICKKYFVKVNKWYMTLNLMGLYIIIC
jgi:uncharacterized protein (UPF0262 family)